ncbi:hypothetical protein SAMN05216554_0656 [Herbiconiux ginsengi]|uniref:Uncharacterized protein n=2 Tax=Herbiconiux ginsengi TaxID=381665 RepID=A0A1H3KS22_9MICO|nr:hypothetical protein SAMN05216554_0656 [Herbiconiux ginsengi]
MLRYTRNVIIWVVFWAVAYSIGTTASKGLCAGGGTVYGGFVDSDGQPTDAVPQCTHLTMSPSWVVYLALVVILVVALTRAARRAGTQAAAVRMPQRAALAVALVAACSSALSLLCFFALPVDGTSGAVSSWLPFPFATVTFEQVPIAT